MHSVEFYKEEETKSKNWTSLIFKVLREREPVRQSSFYKSDESNASVSGARILTLLFFYFWALSPDKKEFFYKNFNLVHSKACRYLYALSTLNRIKCLLFYYNQIIECSK